MQDLWSARITAQQSRQHISVWIAVVVALIFVLICLAALATSA